MIDDLESLRTVRTNIDGPRESVRDAARARWDHQPFDLTTVSPTRSTRGVRAFTTRTAIAAALAIVVIAGAWFVTRQRINSVKPTHVLSVTSLPAVAATDPQVFLLVGSDTRAFVQTPGQAQQFGDPGAVSGSPSDTIILVRIEPATGHVLMVSIPRDLQVDVPGCGQQKINATSNGALVCDDTHGGTQLLVQTITQDLGVPINHVIEVDFPQFASLVDQLGGLPVNFPLPARDQYTGLAEPAGCTTLDGAAALSFVRSRHYEYYRDGQWQEDPAADLGREQRQRLALGQLEAAAEAHVGSDPRPLLRALFTSVTVDPGFTADDALRYFTALRGDHQIVTMTLPVRAAPGNLGYLVLDPAAKATLDALAGRGQATPVPPGIATHADPGAIATPC